MVVTNYFNPLPQAPGPNQDPCGFETLLPTLLIAGQNRSSGDIALAFALDHQAFVQAQRDVQGALHARVDFILNALGGAMADAARGAVKVTIVPITDFVGHDMCQPGDRSWIFGPEYHAHLKVNFGPFFSRSFSIDQAPIPFACPHPDPDPSFEIHLTPTPNPIPLGFFVKQGRQSGELGYEIFSNCLPHPTFNGQAALASHVTKQLPPGVSS